MNHRSIWLALALFALAAVLFQGVPSGQVMRQNANLTIFFSGDDAGEVTPCG